MDAPTEANKAVVQRYLDMWNTGEATIADEVLAPGYVDAAHPEVTGADSVKQSLAQVRAAIPDFFITVEAMVGEGDTIPSPCARLSAGQSRAKRPPQESHGSLACARAKSLNCSPIPIRRSDIFNDNAPEYWLHSAQKASAPVRYNKEDRNRLFSHGGVECTNQKF